MQRIHEPNVDQRTRPDHRRRLDQKLAHGAGKSKTQTLCGQREQDVETPAELASVEVVELLERNHSVEEVTGTTSEGGIGHCDDDNVLFDVEGSRVEVALQSKETDLLAGKESSGCETHRVGDEKHDIGSDVDDGVTEQEQTVDSGADGGQEETNGPCSDGARWHVFVVVSDHGTDLALG